MKYQSDILLENAFDQVAIKQASAPPQKSHKDMSVEEKIAAFKALEAADDDGPYDAFFAHAAEDVFNFIDNHYPEFRRSDLEYLLKDVMKLAYKYKSR